MKTIIVIIVTLVIAASAISRHNSANVIAEQGGTLRNELIGKINTP